VAKVGSIGTLLKIIFIVVGLIFGFYLITQIYAILSGSLFGLIVILAIFIVALIFAILILALRR